MRQPRKLGFAAVSFLLPLSLAGLCHAQGLEPPPPLPPAEPPPPPVYESSDSGSKDSGRGLEWFYLEAEGGISHVGLQTFNIDETNFSAGFIPTEATGPLIGAGVGLRLLFITLGARGRVGLYDAWDMFSVGGEAGFHIPLGNLEPHFNLGGGYTALGSYKSAIDNQSVQGALDNTQIRGFYIRANAGLDYYLTPVLSLGVSASGEVLGLTRPGVDPSKVTAIQNDQSLTSAQQSAAEALKLEGSSYGASVTATAVVGLHL